MLDGMQIVAVFDEWTRPHHAARNGRIYRRGDDGAYRDERGDPLPDLPDEPNCRCMTIPVLGVPRELRGDRAAQRAWRTATGKLIPDPASYLDWWQRATRQQQIAAVGAERFQIVRDALRRQQEPREPEWPDFIDAEGRLLPVERLRRESEEERAARREVVLRVLAERERLFRQATGPGISRGGRPGDGPEGASGGASGSRPPRPPQAFGGGGSAALPPGGSPPGTPGGSRPDGWLLEQLDLGPPKDVTIVYSDRELVVSAGKELFGRALSEEQLARLAGGLDRADVLAGIEGGGLRLETRRRDVRIVRWVGVDAAGRLKIEFYRSDIAADMQRKGLGTRSLVRSVHQSALLGVDYAEATGLRSAKEAGYYYLARCGFDAKLPDDWLDLYREELKTIGMRSATVSGLIRSPEGREFWRLHGQTTNYTMRLGPFSPDLIRLRDYLKERRSEGRAMAEDRSQSRPPDDPDEIVGYDSSVLGAITRADEEAWDRVWERMPLTEEEILAKEKFFADWVPGSRKSGALPKTEALRRQLEREGRLGEITRVKLP